MFACRVVSMDVIRRVRAHFVHVCDSIHNFTSQLHEIRLMRRSELIVLECFEKRRVTVYPTMYDEDQQRLKLITNKYTQFDRHTAERPSDWQTYMHYIAPNWLYSIK